MRPPWKRALDTPRPRSSPTRTVDLFLKLIVGAYTALMVGLYIPAVWAVATGARSFDSREYRDLGVGIFNAVVLVLLAILTLRFQAEQLERDRALFRIAQATVHVHEPPPPLRKGVPYRIRGPSVVEFEVTNAGHRDSAIDDVRIQTGGAQVAVENLRRADQAQPSNPQQAAPGELIVRSGDRVRFRATTDAEDLAGAVLVASPVMGESGASPLRVVRVPLHGEE